MTHGMRLRRKCQDRQARAERLIAPLRERRLSGFASDSERATSDRLAVSPPVLPV
jgi:hypothetical protein